MTEHAGPAMSQAVSVMADVDDEAISKPQVNPKAAPYKQRAELEGLAKAATAIARQQKAVEALKSLSTPSRQGTTSEEPSLQPRTYPSVQTPAAAAPAQAAEVRMQRICYEVLSNVCGVNQETQARGDGARSGGPGTTVQDDRTEVGKMSSCFVSMAYDL